MNLTHLQFSDDFLDSLLSKEFSARERQLFLKALRLLDTDEGHPSLRVHPLQGDLAGFWSASASDALRITFARLPGGIKRLHRCSRHYQ